MEKGTKWTATTKVRFTNEELLEILQRASEERGVKLDGAEIELEIETKYDYAGRVPTGQVILHAKRVVVEE
jgi:hypothetical protein